MSGSKVISLEFPIEVFSARRLSPNEFGRDLRLAAAIYWYTKGEVSQQRAAVIAGMDRTDFLMKLAAERVEVFQVDEDDLKRELALG
jgi:predicted HTH domain antitoxin